MKKRLRVTINAPLVLSLAAISFIATLLNYLTDGASQRLLFMTYHSAILSPMTWVRAFTHIFGHSDWTHLIGNMTYLLLLGPMLEEKYSSRTLAEAVAVTAVVTSMINYVFFPNTALCGASGIVFLFMLLASFTNFREGEIPVTFILVAALFLGQQVYEGLTVQDNISNMAHIVGGVIGGILGYTLNKKSSKKCSDLYSSYSYQTDSHTQTGVNDRKNIRFHRKSRKKKTGKNHKKGKLAAFAAAIVVILLAAYFGVNYFGEDGFPFAASNGDERISELEIPEYAGEAWVEVNNNVPFFESSEMNTDSFENYSDLDDLGRCGVAYANISRELMPTEERGEIGSVQPSGWNQAKYEGVIDSNPAYLYNRCHLIAYCLTAENANEKNLITGTRYLNVEGMLPFENQVANYLDENDNHVLYRVTPVFEGSNLLASGVLMEAYSVEDNGAGICFCVYCYNVQPGITIDYSTGESSLAE